MPPQRRPSACARGVAPLRRAPVRPAGAGRAPVACMEAVVRRAGVAGEGMSRALVILFAVATGQAVASNYLAQPLLDVISHEFSISPGVAGLIVTSAQVGYALGLILMLPLGDLLERRRLITVLPRSRRWAWRPPPSPPRSPSSCPPSRSSGSRR